MYNSNKFWIFATICFAAFTAMYWINNGLFSFFTIINALLFIVSIISLILNKKSSKKNNLKVNPKK